MKISNNWLKNYLTLELHPEKVSRILTDCGLEVEGIEQYESLKGGLQGVFIGEVITCEKHPNSDHLSVTTVDVGRPEYLHIVCGAQNVAAGQKVPVATIGTILYNGNEPFEIKKSKIRGELSEGMICAEDELGIGTSHEGIMVLDPASKVGTSAKEFFGLYEDAVYEIGLTPNRSDATSHFGVARDLAAALNNRKEEKGGVSLKLPDVSAFKTDNHDLQIEVVVESPEACPRYSGVTIKGVKIAPSPQWLQNYLKAIGLRPINNVVDVTNFVLMELGQPLHAFDADQIKGDKVVVKKLAKGTKFITLDEVERELVADDLMICNAEEGMCIGGVFGGLHAGVSDNTVNLFIESAYFDPTHIRKTAKAHGLKTDASFRFERGTDPNATIYALKRAALLIKEVAGGQISSDIVDVYPTFINNREVEINFERVAKVIGKEIAPDIIKSILESLEIKVLSQHNEGMLLSIPTFKVDVTREADVIEEILRIYGYNNIEISDRLNATLSYRPKPDTEKLRNTIADLLASNGYSEIMTNSLTKIDYYQANEEFPIEKSVKILNPLSRDLGVMRQTLLYGGLESVAYNVNRRASDLRFFEFGNVYNINPDKADETSVTKRYTERQQLAIYITGRKENENWKNNDHQVDFFDLKRIILTILSRLGVVEKDIVAEALSGKSISQGLRLKVRQKAVAEFGILSEKLLKQFDLKHTVYYAVIQWEDLLKICGNHKITFSEISKYPEVRRDLALVLDKEITFADIQRIAGQYGKKMLRKVNLFDVYEGDKIEQGKKSYAVSFILQDEDKTLAEKEIDSFMNRLMIAFEKDLGAIIRK
ncbi:MAG: phenylalanine--tRNA ligase subunit beta [Bacteroidetes bacterium]|nr:phenylalanine--tRNA ligase subunit beta [Bacteroidota bacterium]